jgi:dephospho-CoA kinase
MAAFLVTGNPGSGKTALVQELARRGVRASDADDLAEWESTTGAPVILPEELSEQWLRGHRWVWSRRRLERFLSEQGDAPVFLCGIAMNQRDLLDLFDAVFLLSIDDSTQLARLDAARNRNAAQRAQVVAGRPIFEEQMRAAGALVLDGRQPTARVADELLRAAAAGP